VAVRKRDGRNEINQRQSNWLSAGLLSIKKFFELGILNKDNAARAVVDQNFVTTICKK